MRAEQTVTIYADTWLNMIEDRLGFWNWENRVPEFVKDYLMEMLEESGPYMSAEHTDPMFIVDNFIVNGSYGKSKDYRNAGESEDDFWSRMEDEAICCWREEDYVLMCWGF